MESKPKFYSTPEVAEMFSVKPSTVRVWIREGKLRAMQINRYWRVSSEELRRFADEYLDQSSGRSS